MEDIPIPVFTREKSEVRRCNPFNMPYMRYAVNPIDHADEPREGDATQAIRLLTRDEHVIGWGRNGRWLSPRG